MSLPENREEIEAFYVNRAPKGWAALSILAKTQVHKSPSSSDIHNHVWYGACVAEDQNEVWPQANAWFPIARGFGLVFEATLNYVGEIVSVADVGYLFLVTRLPIIQSLADSLDEIVDHLHKEQLPVPGTLSVLDTLSREEFSPMLSGDYYDKFEGINFVPMPRYLRSALFPTPQG